MIKLPSVSIFIAISLCLSSVNCIRLNFDLSSSISRKKFTNVEDAIKSLPFLRTLEDAITATNLTKVFSDPAYKGTLFAPYDLAFRALEFDWGMSKEALLARTEEVNRLLLYHALPQPRTTDDFREGSEVINTELGENVTVTSSSYFVFKRISIKGEQNTVYANLLIGDIEAGNAVIHIIDTVLLPTGVRPALKVDEEMLDISDADIMEMLLEEDVGCDHAYEEEDPDLLLLLTGVRTAFTVDEDMIDISDANIIVMLLEEDDEGCDHGDQEEDDFEDIDHGHHDDEDDEHEHDDEDDDAQHEHEHDDDEEEEEDWEDDDDNEHLEHEQDEDEEEASENGDQFEFQFDFFSVEDDEEDAYNDYVVYCDHGDDEKEVQFDDEDEFHEDGEEEEVATELENDDVHTEGEALRAEDEAEEELAMLEDSDAYYNLLDAFSEMPELRNFSYAAGISGLAYSFYNRKYKATLFAPTNEAFKSLVDSLHVTLYQVFNQPELLKTLVDYHVVPYEATDAEDFENGDVLTTMLDKKLEVDVSRNSIILRGARNDAKIVKSDIHAGKAVMHVIDAVLLPSKISIRTAQTSS